jgi:XTP/dITP diphosphohydrolase
MKLYYASTNPGKLKEFPLIAAESGPHAFTVEPLPGLRERPAPAEDGLTFRANAEIKARYYSGFADGLVFADDSGLAVDALGGAPGVISARYAGEGATDAENNSLLLSELGDRPERSARFVCAIALARSGELLGVFEGAVDGEISHTPRGDGGFGYDPLFYYPPFGCTFGEIGAERKLQVSHRGIALRKLLDYLRNQL